jgi:hypothetical protein
MLFLSGSLRNYPYFCESELIPGLLFTQAHSRAINEIRSMQVKQSYLQTGFLKKMRYCIHLCLAMAALTVCISVNANASPSIHWRGKFNATEQHKLTTWISEITANL